MSVPTTVRAVMNPQFLRSTVPSLEPLETRIAPAGIDIFVGDASRDDIEYTGNSAEEGNPFVQTSANPSDPISALLGPDANVFYLKLNTGDILNIFSGGGYNTFISGPNFTAVKGTVIAIFTDLDLDNEVDADELTGLSLGKNVRVFVSGTISGDVVANYNDAAEIIGGAGDEGNLLNNPIAFFGAGNVDGNIIAGGAIQNVNITGSVNQVLTGNAANGVTYDFNGAVADGGGVLAVTPAAGKAGPNISKINIADVTVIRAGSGGTGAGGGNISKVTLLTDTDGWVVQAGDGGGGTVGGKGGSVSNLLANGLSAITTDTTLNDVVQVFAGKGGDGSITGGKGGTVKNVAIGFEVGPGNSGLQRSINSISDSVLISGGAGGNGRVGGGGGTVVNTDVFSSPTLSGNDLIVRGGAGGESDSGGGRAGAGGAVKDFDVRHPGISADAQQARIIVEGGDGGVAAAGSAGGKGGAVEKGVLIGFSVDINGGTGSQGSNGGAGGNVRGILAQDGFFGVRPKNIAIDAGGGGIGIAGRGGKGGIVDGVTVQNAELSQFDINQDAGAGSGGNSQNGPGGVGGGVFNLTVNDVDTEAPSEVVMRISAGNGGSGGSVGNGGKGGVIGGKNVLEGINASLLVNAGSGGAATGSGSGGAGGGVTSIAFNSVGEVGGVPATATINGGNGGVGIQAGKGGAGGTLSTFSVITDGDIVFQAGAGGNGGPSGASGKGGSISNAATISALGSTTVNAGNAGADGGKAGAGGALTQINVQATTTITIKAGDGGKGGAGGSIKEIGVSDVSQLKGPTLGLSIIAGHGAPNGSTGGAGGSISGVDGFIAGTGDTLIRAGNGADGSAKAGAGGSVNAVTLRGGGGVGAIVNIEAGNAGAATAAKVGSKGGNVTDVGIGLNPFDEATGPTDPFQVQDGTLIRHISAGDGGNTGGGGTGGSGGSLQNIRAYYEIGAMRDEVFGWSTMGGLFAGAGGTGGRPGASGSVTNVSADSIAAILAGRLENGTAITERNYASSVDGLVLNSSEAATVDARGTFLNYDTAAIVGAVRNPEEAGDLYPDPDGTGTHANTFDLNAGDPSLNEYGDNGDGVFGIGDTTNDRTHGFVAALKFGTSSKLTTSVRPEAVLTTNAETGAFIFIDLNNDNGQIKVI